MDLSAAWQESVVNLAQGLPTSAQGPRGWPKRGPAPKAPATTCSDRSDEEETISTGLVPEAETRPFMASPFAAAKQTIPRLASDGCSPRHLDEAVSLGTASNDTSTTAGLSPSPLEHMGHRMPSGPSFQSVPSNDTAEPTTSSTGTASAASQEPSSNVARGAINRNLPLRQQWRFTKILVAGQQGLGKSTWAADTAASYSPIDGAALDLDGTFRLQLPSVPTSPAEQAEAFEQDPHPWCSKFVLRDPVARISHHFTLQDTPSYSLTLSSQHVVDYVKHQLQRHYDQDQDPDRQVPMECCYDPRVDICLLFVSGEGLTAQDNKLVQALAGLVPVVPVIAKADAMDYLDLSRARERVAAQLRRALADTQTTVFRPEHAAAAGAPEEQVFGVIGSTLMQAEPSEGRCWPVREYAWGRCEPFSPQHSDTAALNTLLFDVAPPALKTRTERCYLALRSRCLHKVTRMRQEESEAALQAQREALRAQEKQVCSQLSECHHRLTADFQAREADLLQQLASLQACIKPKYLSKARMRAAQHKAAAQPDSTASLQASASFKGKNPPKPPVSPSPTEESPRPSQNLSEGSPRPSPGPKEGATIPAQSPGSSRSSQSYEAALPNGWTVQQPNGVYENHH